MPLTISTAAGILSSMLKLLLLTLRLALYHMKPNKILGSEKIMNNLVIFRHPPAFKILITCCIVTLLCSCAKPKKIKLPPVTEGWQKSNSIKKGYLVQKNDTLYSIAWSFGLDYRQLASTNNLHPPYKLLQGQRLQIAAQTAATYGPVNKKTKQPVSVPKHWQWPTDGKLLMKFNNKERKRNQGIDLVGKLGQPIVASNDGTIVYSGTGIKAYSKLIIIKHNSDYLSAYAYNKEIFIGERDQVKKGQKIATMGSNREGRAVLHFEIRFNGKPVDPLDYLPSTQ